MRLTYQGSGIGTIETVDGDWGLDVLGGRGSSERAHGSPGEGPLGSRSSN